MKAVCEYAENLELPLMLFTNTEEDVAFYKDGKELYNGSRYVFEIPDAGWQKWEYPCRSKLEQINGRYLLVFYLEKDMLEISAQTQKYSFFYVQDITSVYLESFSLVIKEAFFSLLASVGMAALLVYRIKKNHEAFTGGK